VSEGLDIERLLSLLHGDRALMQHLCDVGFLPEQAEQYRFEHAEIARVAGTLVHELEVNLSGVEIALRLRSELVTTRQQLADLVELLRTRDGSAG
jgi:hypothetical protein